MTEQDQKQLGKTLWSIADQLRGSMNADDFRDCKRQNQLTDAHIAQIVDTYRFRREEDRYSRRVSMKEIEGNDCNLNISRYVSTAIAEQEIDLKATHDELVAIEEEIRLARTKHNQFLKELGLPPCPRRCNV